MDEITYDAISKTVTVLLAGAGAAVLIGNLIKVVKDLRKPRADWEERVKMIERCREEDKETLDDIRESQRLNSQATLALIDHALHNNNQEGLKRSRDELYAFLSER